MQIYWSGNKSGVSGLEAVGPTLGQGEWTSHTTVDTPRL